MNGYRQNNCCQSCQGRQNAVVGNIIVGSGCSEPACNKETTLKNCPIAMAYVPWQSYGNLYPMQQALRIGTLFQELNLDFAGRRCN